MEINEIDIKMLETMNNLTNMLVKVNDDTKAHSIVCMLVMKYCQKVGTDPVEMLQIIKEVAQDNMDKIYRGEM